MIIYKNDTLYQIAIPEGRIIQDSSGKFNYQFEYRDLTGNLRLLYQDPTVGNPSIRMAPEIVQSQDYEPFGVSFNEYFGTKNKNRFSYSNHEIVDDLGLNRIDFGARTYNPTYGRFDRVDPLAGNAPDWSQYRAFFNNLVKYIDPNGLFELPKEFQEKYPEFTKFLKNLVNDFKNKSDEFKNNFYQKSGLSEKETNEMLTFGKGPLLTISDLDNQKKRANGETLRDYDKNGNIINAKKGKGHIKLDDDIVNMFENANNVKESRIGNIMVESTLFHEGTHFGNLKHGDPEGNGNYFESGKEFEKSVYGQDIDRGNVKKYYENNSPRTIRNKITLRPIKTRFK